MEYIYYTIYTITLILLILFNVYIYHSLISSKFGKYPPYVPTSRKRQKIIFEEFSHLLENEKDKLIFDAGSGTGSILIPLAKKFPQHKFIGIEWSKLPFLVSKFKSRKLKNITFINDDIFKQNFSNADFIYCYVVKNFEKPLSDKILHDVKKGCIVITNGTVFKEMELLKNRESPEKWTNQGIYIHSVK